MSSNDLTPEAIPVPAATAAAGERVLTFLRAVYGWMFVGLAVTAAVAWYVASSPAILSAIAGNRILFWAVLLAPLGLVIWLSARVAQLAPATAATLFLVYSALTGVMFAFILLAYTGQSVASVFLVTSGMFGGLALYGTVTKRDLSGVGQFAMMGLIGVVIASIARSSGATICCSSCCRSAAWWSSPGYGLGRQLAPRHGPRAARR
jgi:FtsH-binding integral membrane protein